MSRHRLVLSVALALSAAIYFQLTSSANAEPGDAAVQKYFEAETAALTNQPIAGVTSLDEWKSKRERYHDQLKEMLGLEPWPEKTDLKTTVTGTLEADGVVVEKIHFQSRPGLYVTGNLYRPAKSEGRLPAILYVCGHGKVVENGVSLGNKTHYQHHGAWFARHGFICLTIDTLQLGEIEGLHHGTHNLGMWWWINRGYTPAGVEAWNCVRAIDLLQARDDVDPEKIGVTGRSGGGAYSWYIAALDDRIKAAVPVAGITDMQNHIVDGCINGHCDCMFWVNTPRYDFSFLPALVAPRPLMIANTDSDPIFPLDGVTRTFFEARDIYSLYDAKQNLGLCIVDGGHADTQPLRVPAFYWLSRHLKGETPLIDVPATPLFAKKDLKVFAELPADEINTKIQETFVPVAPPAEVPASETAWKSQAAELREKLLTKSFAGWPKLESAPQLKQVAVIQIGETKVTTFDLETQPGVTLPLLLIDNGGAGVTLSLADQADWTAIEELNAVVGAPPKSDAAKALLSLPGRTYLLVQRGVGPTEWSQDKKLETHIRRRFLQLGQTVDGMRVWDARRAIQAIGDPKLTISAAGVNAGVAVYATIFEPSVAKIDATHLPADERDGPILLNVRRFMNMPEAVALAAENAAIEVDAESAAAVAYAQAVGKQLKWPADQVSVKK
ncbi:acetylxylan esterase [Blastopirellula sp. JC732]|uniref:Acetylxylan esterase n=1 Tax=Blastopirellula sediminis TaxID=2894196 RepID=A0A9X1MNF4_9BACT|nr:acetylxylan esterase [Blastopirellula sediminis]MCC9606814.1 acetylxylan esterase [Blastopirellula sediminis]MCC9629889.1 acetylxylan esterase [Blastopirellula sediminis]